jgi:hypothetical protein
MQRLSSVVRRPYLSSIFWSLHRPLLRSRGPLPAWMKRRATQRAAQRETSSVQIPWRVGRNPLNQISFIVTFTSCVPGRRQMILRFVLRNSGTGDSGIPILLILLKAHRTYN